MGPAGVAQLQRLAAAARVGYSRRGKADRRDGRGATRAVNFGRIGVLRGCALYWTLNDFLMERNVFTRAVPHPIPFAAATAPVDYYYLERYRSMIRFLSGV